MWEMWGLAVEGGKSLYSKLGGGRKEGRQAGFNGYEGNLEMGGKLTY